MYNVLYPKDTEKNRKEFLANWVMTYCRKQNEINFGISATCLAMNFTRCYFPLTKEELIEEFLKQGYIMEIKENETYFNFSSDSSSMKDFKMGWD